jgi:hypothetical protein
VSSTENIPLMKLKDFIQDCPPSSPRKITDIDFESKVIQVGTTNYMKYAVSLPPIQLDCTSNDCDGVRTFDGRPSDGSYERAFYVGAGSSDAVNVLYTCRHCRKSFKYIGMLLTTPKPLSIPGIPKGEWSGVKIGEWPAHGRKPPSKLISMIRPDRDFLVKGLRCESQGMGIAALIYYRRVVEDQRDAIIDAIIKVGRASEAPEEHLSRIEREKGNWQFASSIEAIGDAIPPSLMIFGRNPLLLLHRATSGAIHKLTDSECLERAQTVYKVLCQFSDKVDRALSDQNELRSAIEKLMVASPAAAELDTDQPSS